MTWVKFKSFFQKNLRGSRTFVNNLLSKFKYNLQYWSESMLDWASYLKHLQSILLEFDIDGILGEPTIIKYFRESLKPSIWAKIEQRSCKLDSFKDTLQKAVNVEVKAAL